MPPERRYPSDLTDRQWELIEPLLPEPPAGPAGRPPEHSKREIVNAILYLTRTGCAWRMLPKDFPPWQTVYRYFRAWGEDGTLDRVHDALRERVRAKREGRNPEPSAGIVDSQSVKGSDTVSKGTRGYDAGKKINGRKRHIITDTLGLLLVVMVTAASIQDRDGGRGILKLLKGALPGVRHIFADGGYQGQLIARQARLPGRRRGRQEARRADRLRGAAPPLGGRAHLLLASALATAGARLRTPTRDPRSVRQVGHGRAHAQPPLATTRTQALGHQQEERINSETPSQPRCSA